MTLELGKAMKFYFTQELKSEILKILDSLEKSLDLNEKTIVYYTNQPKFGRNYFTIGRNTGFYFNGNEIKDKSFPIDFNSATLNKNVYNNYMEKFVEMNRDDNLKCNFADYNLNEIFANMFTYWALRKEITLDIENRSKKEENFEEKTLDINFKKEILSKEDFYNRRKEILKEIIPTIKVLMCTAMPNNIFKVNFYHFKSIIQKMPTDEDFKTERFNQNNPASFMLGDLNSWTEALAEIYND